MFYELRNIIFEFEVEILEGCFGEVFEFDMFEDFIREVNVLSEVDCLFKDVVDNLFRFLIE